MELRHHLAAQCISTHGADVHQEYVYQASPMNLEWSKDKNPLRALLPDAMTPKLIND